MKNSMSWAVLGFFGGPALLIGGAYVFAFPWQALGIAALLIGPPAIWLWIETDKIHDNAKEAAARREAQFDETQRTIARSIALDALDPAFQLNVSVTPPGHVEIKRASRRSSKKGWASDLAIQQSPFFRESKS